MQGNYKALWLEKNNHFNLTWRVDRLMSIAVYSNNYVEGLKREVILIADEDCNSANNNNVLFYIEISKDLI